MTDAALIVAASEPLQIKSIPAHPENYSRLRRIPINVVIHATHGVEGPNKDYDEAMALTRPLAPGSKRSFHYVVDSNSATRCVPDLFTAWHAGKTGNARAIGVEICGRADQTREQWLDSISLSTLRIAARLVADLCTKYGIPPVLVDVTGLKMKTAGITTHHLVTQAFKESVHWDPGPNFPLTEFISAVGRAIAAG